MRWSVIIRSEYLEKHIPEMAEAAVKQAYWQDLSSGSSVLVSDNGTIEEVFPDGTTRITQENEPFKKTEKDKSSKLNEPSRFDTASQNVCRTERVGQKYN